MTTGGPEWRARAADNQPNVLDQMMVNKNMAASTAPIRAVAGSVKSFTG
jgi:hypothetical protein